MQRERRALAALVSLAFALRLTWVLVASRADFAANDSLFYWMNANSLAHGDVYSQTPGIASARWPPGYPAVLSVLVRIFGHHPIAGEILNAVLGAVTVLLLYLLVKPYFGKRVAFIAASMLCVMPGPILWTDLLMTETLFTLMLVAFFLLVLRSRPSFRWAAIIGVYVGLATLTRSEALIWLTVPLVLWAREIGWKKVLPRLAVTGATVLLVLMPWTIRNSRAMGSFVMLSTNGGQTLWAGHNPNADGMQNYPSPELEASFGTGAEWEINWYKGLQGDAVHYMLTHPLRELELIPLKLIALNRGDSNAFDWLNQEPNRTLGSTATAYVSAMADFAWFVLLALTLVGVVGLHRSLWRTRLMVGITAAFGTALFVYGFLYYGNYRYRLPYEPLMMVVAALVVDRGWRGLAIIRAADADADAGAADNGRPGN